MSRLNRFYIDQDLSQTFFELADEELLKQINKVLRLKVGEEFCLFNEKQEIVVEILSASRSSINVSVKNRKEIEKTLNHEVTLYLSILKRENFELSVQKATEVGVKKIVPIISERTVKLGFRYDRLKKIAVEATEQSGRLTIPEISEPLSLKEAIDEARGNNQQNLFFDLSGQTFLGSDCKKIGIFIGPEGGWTIHELESFRVAGFDLCSLGGTVLRAETAAIVASYLTVNGFQLPKGF